MTAYPWLSSGIPAWYYISTKRGIVLEVLINTARLIYIFMRSSSTGAGLGGEAGSMVITASKNGGAGAVITPAIVDLSSSLGAGWYTLAMTAGQLNTLGQMALHIVSSNTTPNDDVLLNVIAVDKTDAVHFGLSSLPNAAATSTGGLPTLGTGANQFTTDGAGNVNADVEAWREATPNTLSSGLVEATIDGSIIVTNVNVVEWLGATPAALDGSGNVPANVMAVGNAAAVAAAVLDAARSGHITLGTVGEGIALATSLLQGNFFIDNVTPSANGPTAQRIRCWLSASAMAGVTPGGTGQGEFATFLVTTTYSGPGVVVTHKVIQQ